MRPEQTRRSRWLPRFVGEHPWISVYAAIAVPLAALDIHRDPGRVPVWLLAFAALVAVEAVTYRLQIGTRLDRRTFSRLVKALTAQPVDTLLVDRETRDALNIRRRRVLASRSWVVQRFADGAVDETMQDFNIGQLSTLPVAQFVIGRRNIASVDDVIAVRPGADGEPEEIPGGDVRHTWRGVWFRIRAGTTVVTAAEVEHLTAQLVRAEPIRPEPEDEYAAT